MIRTKGDKMGSKSVGFVKLSVAVLILASWLVSTVRSSQQPARVDFGRDVQPIFRQHCIDCHGPSQQMLGFRLDRRADAMRGNTKAVIVPGNSSMSRLYLKLIGSKYGLQMPPTGALSEEQINVIKMWIDQGAQWPDDLSGDAATAPPDSRAVSLMKSLRDGDVHTFNKMAREEAKIGNLRGTGGTTLLMQAVLYGDSESVRLLLEGGADCNLKNDVGATALMWALDDPVKTRLLLAHGAEVNTRSDDNRTPLLIASGQMQSPEVLRLLLDRGADPSVKSIGVTPYSSPLAEATRTGIESRLRLLIEHGTDVRSAGLGALEIAERAQCKECLDILLEAADHKTLTQAALRLAPPAGDGITVKRLLERGADPNATDPDGYSLLMLVASSDAIPVETVKTLIARGANLNAKNPDGKTALDLARLRGSTPVVGLLVKAGAKPGVSLAYDVPRPKPAVSIRAAVERSIPLLQKTDSIFLQKTSCVSCHHNTLTAMTVATARKNGFSVDDQVASGQVKRIGAFIEKWRERILQGVGVGGASSTLSSILLGLADENYPPDAATDAVARFVLWRQMANGRWNTTAHRPPTESSDVYTTAISLRALKVYGPKAQRAKYDEAVKRAMDWLIQVKPQDTAERAYRLFGLTWGGLKTDNQIVKDAVGDLIAHQRSDGGWSSLASLASDAYSTGLALVALKQAGVVGSSDVAFKRGIGFLLKTQLEDGSWYVKSRAVPFQPYFESGFPHGHDQWISAAGTNWATTALALAAGPSKTGTHK